MVPWCYQGKQATESIAVGQLLSTAAAGSVCLDFADVAVNWVEEMKTLTLTCSEE